MIENGVHLTIGETARRYGGSNSRIGQLIAEHRLPVAGISHGWRVVLASDIDRLIAEREAWKADILARKAKKANHSK